MCNHTEYSIHGIQETVAGFCSKYEFPSEAKTCFSDAVQALAEDQEAWLAFVELIRSYTRQYDMDHVPIFAQLDEIGKATGVHPYTVHMIYMIALTPHLRELYTENGYSQDIYDSSVLDLKWKLFECWEVYRVWGIFVGWWTIGFFQLKLFGMGRLEFNLRPCAYTYSDGTHTIQKGDPTVEVHIPSCGPLQREEYLASYARAEAFFQKHFPNGKTVFSCHSWLLSPNNKVILPPTSRIREFAADYTLIRAKDDPSNGNLWRIFGQFNIDEDFGNLPADTSLRRCFIEWLKAGNNIGQGYGLIFYQNGMILN